MALVYRSKAMDPVRYQTFEGYRERDHCCLMNTINIFQRLYILQTGVESAIVHYDPALYPMRRLPGQNKGEEE